MKSIKAYPRDRLFVIRRLYIKPTDKLGKEYNPSLLSLKFLERDYLSFFVKFYTKKPLDTYKEQLDFDYKKSLNWKEEKEYLSREDVIEAYAKGVNISLSHTDSYIRSILQEYSLKNKFRKIRKEFFRKKLLNLKVEKRTAAIIIAYYLIGGSSWISFKDLILEEYRNGVKKIKI